MPLMIKRKKGESLFIGYEGDFIKIEVIGLGQESVTLSVNAPRKIKIERSERIDNYREEGQQEGEE
jgi:carbon storage regulator CsrA